MASLRVWIFSVVTTVEHKAETQVYEGHRCLWRAVAPNVTARSRYHTPGQSGIKAVAFTCLFVRKLKVFVSYNANAVQYLEHAPKQRLKTAEARAPLLQGLPHGTRRVHWSFSRWLLPNSEEAAMRISASRANCHVFNFAPNQQAHWCEGKAIH
jgi:hypothetical protein